MPSVYDPENYKGRVDFAAKYIAANQAATRRFDTCFEMSDGDLVSVALYRRAQKRPDTKLAQNLFKYLGRESVLDSVDKYAGTKTEDLPTAAAEAREKARKDFEAWLAKTQP